jgi:hypothetical protein
MPNLFDGCFDEVEQTNDNEFSHYERLYPKYVNALSSTAHTYGNVLATAQHWILNIFDHGRADSMFKTIHVSSRIAHSQLVRTPQQHIKKERPMIIFSPRIEYGEDTFLKHTLITEKRGGIYTTGTNGVVDLQPFFYDGERGVSMYYTLARRCMYIDVVLSFNTMMEQLNYMDYLMAQLDWETPFDINTWLEAYLSIELMQMLSDVAGIPIHNKYDNTVTDFLNYVNAHSCYPVTYKLTGSTGKEEFYRYYKENMIATLTNLDRNNGDNVNHIMTNYTISFSLRLEFWSPALLYLMSEKITSMPTVVPGDSTLIPTFADVFVLEDLNLAPGWQVYGHCSFILEKKNDSVDYSNLVQAKVREVISYHLKNGISVRTFLDIKVRKMGTLLIEGADYTVDYGQNTVKFNNKEWGFDTYTVIVTVNTLYVNELIKNINDLD